MKREDTILNAIKNLTFKEKNNYRNLQQEAEKYEIYKLAMDLDTALAIYKARWPE